jgi:O-acetylserine/cysteine efflux transporter
LVRTLRPRDIALLVVLGIVWGFNFVPIRWALDAVPPFALAATRFFFAAVPMVFFIPRPTMPWRWIALYGLAIGVGQFGVLFLAIAVGMPAGLASLLMQLQVFATIGLAAVFLGDRATPLQLGGALVAAGGMTLLVFDKLQDGQTGTFLSLVLTLAAAASWAVGNIIARYAGRTYGGGGFSLVVWSSLFSPLPLAALSFATEGGTAPLAALADAGWLAWGSIVFIVVGATLWGFATWNRMLQRYPAAAVTPFALIVPVAGLASAYVLLGEVLSALEIVGAVLILVGLSIAVVRPIAWATRARAWRYPSDGRGSKSSDAELMQ